MMTDEQLQAIGMFRFPPNQMSKEDIERIRRCLEEVEKASEVTFAGAPSPSEEASFRREPK